MFYRSLRRFALALLLLPAAVLAGQSSSSSSSNPGAADDVPTPTAVPRTQARADASGSAITLEASDALFAVATAMNTCGYDAGLESSAPVRSAIRADVAAAVADSDKARASRDALCTYMREHTLADRGRDMAQYVSLALYLTPALEPSADQTEMPPDALQVVNMLPLLRAFVEAANLRAIRARHAPEYDAVLARVHDPLTSMILSTNIYLRVPVSSYDGRRLIVLVEPMLAPNAANARIYSTDYVVVTSPNAAGTVQLDQVRHLYLHYELEPLVYARSTSMQRLLPLLKPVQDAPLDFIYKSDVVALVTECLIKAIEARLLDTGAEPIKPQGTRARAELARYDEEMAAYARQAAALRAKQVDLSMRQGWVLTEYFYDQLGLMERNPEGLSESMGQMVYGMDIDRQKHREEEIHFLPAGSGEFVRRVARPPTGLMLAERDLMEGKLVDAELLADKALADPAQDHAEALYVKSRVALLEGDPDSSSKGFAEVIATAKNPRTVAWAHIYLGRLYDTRVPAERGRALGEYKAALAVDGIPDAHAAAEAGLRKPFTIPRVEHVEEEPLDPTGKAEKDAYQPDAPSPPKAKPAPAKPR